MGEEKARAGLETLHKRRVSYGAKPKAVFARRSWRLASKPRVKNRELPLSTPNKKRHAVAYRLLFGAGNGT